MSAAVGEFRLAYQPRIELRSMKTACVEALLRWQHPQRGALLPDDFIPEAEDAGTIVELGEWVLHEAARQHSAWREQGRAVKVAVNVSMLQIESDGFLPCIESLLINHGLQAWALEIEVTESRPMRDPPRAARTFDGLRKLGIALALDDFGRGFSGVQTLRWVPADVIKFDKLLVESIDTDPRSARTLSALVDFVHAMGALTVAEGVERPAQLDLLRDMGCDQAQGYLLGMPRMTGEMGAGLDRLQGHGLKSGA